MSIYPKRNTRGSLTGKYLVEVNTPNGRKRSTANTLVEARNIEERLHVAFATKRSDGVMGPAGSFKPMPATIVAPEVSNALYTIGSLRNDARVIWRGNKDEHRSLQQFDACCDILGYATNIKSVRTKQLDLVVEKLRARGLSDTSCHRYLATVSAALRWAHKRDHIDGMPHIPWPEQGKPRDAIFTEQDQGRFLEWLEARGYHSTAIIYRVLFSTGMRIGELLGLNEEDIDVDNETVTLRDTKNGDNRTVPLEAKLCADLRGLLDSDDMPNYDQLRRVVVRAASDLGIGYSITPHVVRHTVVTRLEAAGVGLKTIGALVGHRSIATTSRYAHPNQVTLRAATAKLKG